MLSSKNILYGVQSPIQRLHNPKTDFVSHEILKICTFVDQNFYAELKKVYFMGSETGSHENQKARNSNKSCDLPIDQKIYTKCKIVYFKGFLNGTGSLFCIYSAVLIENMLQVL
jgi:hypothetical protein